VDMRFESLADATQIFLFRASEWCAFFHIHTY
jgi:hypothetical protein